MSRLTVPGGFKSERVWLTPEGGVASKFTNNSGGTLAHGTAVSLSSSNDASVVPQNNEYDCIGFVYGSSINGGDCWVITCGVAEALFANGNQPQRGYWVKCSATDGRVEAAVGPSSVSAIAAAEHFREVGHCLETKAAGTGVVARIVVHPL